MGHVYRDDNQGIAPTCLLTMPAHHPMPSACRTIRIWGDDGNAEVLEGHEGPVQCLLVLPDGSLVSGSNDKTVKIWQGTSCVKTLTGHSDTVRCTWCWLLHVPSLTAAMLHVSALFLQLPSRAKSSRRVSTICNCRGLSLVPDLGFASASHDGTLQLWTMSGEPIGTLAGHTALVYRQVPLSQTFPAWPKCMHTLG